MKSILIHAKRAKIVELICLVALVGGITSSYAQQTQPAPGQQAPQSTNAQPASQTPTAGQSAPRFNIYPTYVADDTKRFTELFDGKTLTNWDGDPNFWRAENGEIIGESTPDKVVKLNTFLIYRGGLVKDFELKVDFKINSTNSGIQYRSVEMPEAGKWVLKGYQADFEPTNNFTGNIHEERGRNPPIGHVVLSKRGAMTRTVEGPGFQTVATIADEKLLRGVINVGAWNTYHIIARGPIIIQIINGQVMSILMDEDTKNFRPEGLLGLQMHIGPPFKVEYKNILLKKL